MKTKKKTKDYLSSERTNCKLYFRKIKIPLISCSCELGEERPYMTSEMAYQNLTETELMSISILSSISKSWSKFHIIVEKKHVK